MAPDGSDGPGASDGRGTFPGTRTAPRGDGALFVGFDRDSRFRGGVRQRAVSGIRTAS